MEAEQGTRGFVYRMRCRSPALLLARLCSEDFNPRLMERNGKDRNPASGRPNLGPSGELHATTKATVNPPALFLKLHGIHRQSPQGPARPLLKMQLQYMIHENRCPEIRRFCSYVSMLPVTRRPYSHGAGTYRALEPISTTAPAWAITAAFVATSFF